MFLQFLIICLFTMAVRGTLVNPFYRSKPGCSAMCGDIKIPYPFGIGNDTGCSLDNSFYVTCNMSESPPKLYLGSSNIEIYNIFDTELRVKTGVSYRCYHSNGTVSSEFSYNWTSLSTLTFSAKNMFKVIGCDDYAVITGEGGGDYFSSGCIGLCSKQPDALTRRVSLRQGCCQNSISKGLQFYNVTLNRFRNNPDVSSSSSSNCSLAFLSEEHCFQFQTNHADDWDLRDRIESNAAVVLDWVIASEQTTNCSESNMCKDNSECYDVHGGGYRCECKEGYYGNPYLDQGCQDINECEHPQIYACHGDCINTPGNYTCTCPLGYVGDNLKSRFGYCERQATTHSKKLGIIFILLGVILGTGILALAIWMSKVVQKRKEKKRRDKFFKRNGGLLFQQQTSSGEDAIERTRMFSARELQKATDQYNRNRIVGRGGQGTVYKGMLPNGKIVAVKKSVLVDETQVESFINEVFLLSQISHRNVVKLLGCCLETEVPILVYEFVSNGDLFQFIHDESYEFPTFWSIRITIATEVAGALSYMHSATSIPIYHRDIKSSNILLDEKFRAKLSDFGISKSVMGDQTHLSTLVKGTYGYLDPEYFQSNQFTEKSDVYSFGIVLVELLTGKKPIYSIGPGEMRSLATLILSMDERLILENIDDRVVSDGPKEQLIAVAKLAKRCLNLNGKLRPTMKEVATDLEGIRSSSH
uniref:putative wall-associated receptor kinase-like 16 n=1 Tax=Erigeron canadensis TaxID=72917 RepID=UPI001CB91F94|nr:putative wall-associated receptor kinase-like 16 [Erigeron canadensis]